MGFRELSRIRRATERERESEGEGPTDEEREREVTYQGSFTGEVRPEAHN